MVLLFRTPIVSQVAHWLPTNRPNAAGTVCTGDMQVPVGRPHKLHSL